VEVATVGHAFRELRPFLGDCRFADCRHRSEPGCAVIEAVSDGSIDPGRYESYLTILAEAESEEEDARTGGGG